MIWYIIFNICIYILKKWFLFISKIIIIILWTKHVRPNLDHVNLWVFSSFTSIVDLCIYRLKIMGVQLVIMRVQKEQL